MNITIELLGRGVNPSRILADDGWSIIREHDAIWASHPDVADEPAARSRLSKLHLLTSSSVRIEFNRVSRYGEKDCPARLP